MKKEIVEILSDECNSVVIRTPGRNFPGIVIQGDTLRNLLRLAERVCQAASNVHNDELRDNAESLHDLLHTKLLGYELALREHGMELPYPCSSRVSD